MTDERNTRQSSAETDPLVTRIYREGADESAPERLNRAILKKAEKAARPRYQRFNSWARPMAWAATAVLSVALVLEIRNAPTPESAIFDDSAGKFEMQETDSPANTPADQLEESVAPATPPGRTSKANTVVYPQAAKTGLTAKQAASKPEPEKRQRDDVQQNRVAEQELATPASSIGELKLKDTEMAVQGVAATSIEAPDCDESVTASPETWLECIANLEEAGLADKAGLQRERLHEAFPDFNLR